MVQLLAQLGLQTVDDLRDFSPCRAFLLLKKAKLSVTQSVFWQLVALCENRQPENLSDSQRADWQEKLRMYPPVDWFPDENEMRLWMQAALNQAQIAAAKGEIPVGAVIVHEGKMVAAAHNLCVVNHSVCQHAEIQVIEQAGKFLKNYRLSECDLYVTLEPCAMCAGAIVQARIRRVIFAAHEAKTGAAGSVLNLFENKLLNAHTAVHSGVMAAESQQLLQAFFAARRGKSFLRYTTI